MKCLVAVFLGVLPFSCFSQNEVPGKYKDYFKSYLQLNSDSTFYFYRYFDLRSSWTKGTWKFEKDTIELIMHPVYDTISVIRDNSGRKEDSLVLSVDENADRRSEQENSSVKGVLQVQNGMTYPQKLFYQKEKLYEVKDGQLLKWMYYDGRKRGKLPLWFYKS